MDNKVAMMLEKVKIMAGKTSKAATRAVESAGKAAGDMAQATKINLQIFDLNTDCEVLYKEIGKLVYDIHLGADVAPDAMDDYLDRLDDTRSRVEELRAQLSEMKASAVCPVCGRQCSREDVFCASCGAPLHSRQQEEEKPAGPYLVEDK